MSQRLANKVALVVGDGPGMGRTGALAMAAADRAQMVWRPQAPTPLQQLHIMPIPTPEAVAPLVVYLDSDEPPP